MLTMNMIPRTTQDHLLQNEQHSQGRHEVWPIRRESSCCAQMKQLKEALGCMDQRYKAEKVEKEILKTLIQELMTSSHSQPSIQDITDGILLRKKVELLQDQVSQKDSIIEVQKQTLLSLSAKTTELQHCNKQLKQSAFFPFPSVESQPVCSDQEKVINKQVHDLKEQLQMERNRSAAFVDKINVLEMEHQNLISNIKQFINICRIKNLKLIDLSEKDKAEIMERVIVNIQKGNTQQSQTSAHLIGINDMCQTFSNVLEEDIAFKENMSQKISEYEQKYEDKMKEYEQKISKEELKISGSEQKISQDKDHELQFSESIDSLDEDSISWDLESEVAGDEPEVTADDTDVSDDEPEVTADESDIPDDEPEVTADEPEVSDDESDFSDDEPEVSDYQPEVSDDESDFSDDDEPEVLYYEPEVSDYEPEVLYYEPEVSDYEPEVSDDESNVPDHEKQEITKIKKWWKKFTHCLKPWKWGKKSRIGPTVEEAFGGGGDFY